MSAPFSLSALQNSKLKLAQLQQALQSNSHQNSKLGTFNSKAQNDTKSNDTHEPSARNHTPPPLRKSRPQSTPLSRLNNKIAQQQSQQYSDGKSNNTSNSKPDSSKCPDFSNSANGKLALLSTSSAALQRLSTQTLFQLTSLQTEILSVLSKYGLRHMADNEIENQFSALQKSLNALSQAYSTHLSQSESMLEQIRAETEKVNEEVSSKLNDVMQQNAHRMKVMQVQHKRELNNAVNEITIRMKAEYEAKMSSAERIDRSNRRVMKGQVHLFAGHCA